MKMLVSMVVCVFTVIFTAAATHYNHQTHHKSASRGCISKYYNKDLGPLEILLMPLGEKLWLRAWLGMHMSNLLHMEGVDLTEITHSENERKKRSVSQDVLFSQETTHNSELHPGSLIANSYHVSLHPYVKSSLFHGKLEINITCLQSTNNIVLQADRHMKIAMLEVNQLTNNVPGRNISSENISEIIQNISIPVKQITWYVKESKCVIHLQRALMKGIHYQLHIQYFGEMNNKSQGLYVHNYRVDNNTSKLSWFMGTHMKDGSAKFVFPYFQDPRHKAVFKISVAHPKEMMAISNTPLQFSETCAEQQDWEWDHFLPSPPMSVESLGIFIFNTEHFHRISSSLNKGELDIFGYAQQENLVLVQDIVDAYSKSMMILEKELGVPFPLQQLNIVILPENTMTVGDFWGLIILENNYPQLSMWYYLLRQWFGHLVTATNLDDEYISASLAHYYSHACPLSFDICESEESSQWMYYNFIALYDINEIFDPNDFKYHKLVFFLRMLNHSLSQISFHTGVEIFLKYRSFSTFVEEDLWDALDIQAWSDGTLDRSMSTKNIAESWLNQDFFPLITIIRNYEENSALVEQKVFVKRWPYTVRGYEKMLWWIPLTFITSEDLFKGCKSSLLWIKREKYSSLENLTAPDSFVIANYDDIGMYIVNYDSHNWKLLSEHLSKNKPEKSLISTLNRASLIRNVWHLAFAGHLDFETALDMTMFLQHEKEYIVFKTLIQIYYHISWNLMGTGMEIKFDRFIGNLLVHMYERNKNIQFHENNIIQVHKFLYNILCRAGYTPVIHSARLVFQKWLQEQHSVDDSVIGGVMYWIREDWEEGFSYVLHSVNESRSIKNRSFLLKQLAISSKQECINRLLKILFIDPVYQFTNGELKNTLRAVRSCQYVLEFLIENWNVIKDRYENKPNIWHFILEESLRKCKTSDDIVLAEKFYKSYQRELSSSVSVVKHTLEVLKRNLAIIYKKIPHFEISLDGRLKNLDTNMFYTIQ